MPDTVGRGSSLRWAAAALGCLTLLGCTASPLDPEATVTVRGAAFGVDGAPLADRPVRLDSDLAPSDLLLAVPTFGLACLGDGCGAALDQQRTAPDGRFTLTTTGARTQTSFGGLRTLAVSVSAAPGPAEVTGASATARFTARVAEPVLPPLRLVDPRLQLRADGGRLVAQWDADAGAQQLRWVSGDGAAVWTAAAVDGTAAVDARVLEGSAGAAVLTGTRTDVTDGSDVTTTWSSPGTAYATRAAVPVSRGAPCSTDTTDTAHTAHTAHTADAADAAACRLTDGDLASAAGPSAGACPEAGACTVSVEVRLADAPVVDLLVVRGCDGGCDVTVDGPGGPRPLGRLAGDAEVHLPAAAVTRVVVTGADLHALREISAWAPARADTPPSVVGPPAAAAAFPSPDEDRGLPVLAVAVAAVLLVAAATAAGAALARRRPE